MLKRQSITFMISTGAILPYPRSFRPAAYCGVSEHAPNKNSDRLTDIGEEHEKSRLSAASCGYKVRLSDGSGHLLLSFSV